MKVSVVIPVYNGEEFLEECLHSVSVQTFRDFEVVIVNDGSTDGTLRIAKSAAVNDPRFKIITTGNRGVSAARNIGISAAEGEYVTFVDADDCLYPQALEFLIRAALERGADVCIGGIERGLVFEPVSYQKMEIEEYGYEEAMRFALYQKRIMNSPCGMLIKREFLLNEKGFREGIRYEDLDAFYRFYQYSETIVLIKENLYFYRDNSASFMNQWSEGRLDVLDVTDRMVEFFKERHSGLLRAAEDRRFSAHYNILLLMLRNKVENTEALERCRKIIKRGRRRALLDPNVRLKNKIGALLSYGGIGLIRLFA